MRARIPVVQGSGRQPPLIRWIEWREEHGVWQEFHYSKPDKPTSFSTKAQQALEDYFRIPRGLFLKQQIRRVPPWRLQAVKDAQHSLERATIKRICFHLPESCFQAQKEAYQRNASKA